MVHLVVLDLADVTVLRLDRFAVGRVVDVVLDEAVGGIHVGRGEHGLLAQGADARLREHRFVALHLGGSSLALEGLRADPPFLGIGAEDITCGVDQLDLLLGRQERQQIT